MYVAEVEGLAKAEAGNSRDATETSARRKKAPADLFWAPGLRFRTAPTPAVDGADMALECSELMIEAVGQRRILAPARTNRDGFDRLDDGGSRCGGRADQGAVRGATPIQQNVQHAFWSVR
jgi:hypothetical protein